MHNQLFIHKGIALVGIPPQIAQRVRVFSPLPDPDKHVGVRFEYDAKSVRFEGGKLSNITEHRAFEKRTVYFGDRRKTFWAEVTGELRGWRTT